MASGNSPRVSLRAFLCSLVAAAFCAGMFLGIAIILSWLRGSMFLESDSLVFAALCVVIAWLFVALFLFGRQTLHVPLHHSAVFLANARQVLEEMGYEVTSQSGQSLGTRRGFQFLFMGRGIRIDCADHQARITGPKLWVDALRRRLRVQIILSASELAMHDDAEPAVLLKRVQIQMRVSPGNLEEVCRHVLQLLAREGDVVCDINLLANSDAGIRESTVEQQIRPWLRERGVSAAIHKDLVQMSEPMSTMILPGNRRRRRLYHDQQAS
jgi:hypothetical protein